ncbi:MAG TPA: anhydro-N-acetylmuramic acid kinase [Ferrovibrio sp.]|uniref:anhydro-N-acetylmuramic acid kinase n=1 Tax=Ferrovibrio sp. TaxID=1917215 RepID=UPI002ED3B11F
MQPCWIMGLMSGTSMDGIDAALLRTDGERIAEFGPALTMPYEAALRDRLRKVLGGTGEVLAVSRAITIAHAEAVRALLDRAGMRAADVAWLGFHGHTVLHRPDQRRTWQIGDGALLAGLAGIGTVSDFRSQDVAMGGQGAPLVPLYHAALARHAGFQPPLLVLNLGGVGNVTYIGSASENEGGDDLIAFDTGPGNALIDDWMRRHAGQPQDEGGAFAARGRIDEAALAKLLAHPYFQARPPKSLDRDDFAAFAAGIVAPLAAEDGAATLTAFTAAAVARGLEHLPRKPTRCLVAGGGRHNATMMRLLTRHLDLPVETVDAVGWRGDHLEAEAFAFLAARAVRGLPLSLPATTGVPRPVGGGRLYKS